MNTTSVANEGRLAVGGRHAAEGQCGRPPCGRKPSIRAHGALPQTRPHKCTPEVEKHLKCFLQGHICLLGIGNRLWRDDGVGSYVAEALQSQREFDSIDAGSVPENYLETVVGKHPETILIIDATDFGGAPGELRLLETDKIAQSGISTHAGSLQMLAKYLRIRTGARIGLLAIQPGDSSAGKGLSPEVAEAAAYLQQALLAVVGASIAREGL